MMKRIEITPDTLHLQIHRLWGEQWLLLGAGDFPGGDYNCMTVAWGSLGTMWNKPFVQVVVRPSRYTFRFMEEYDEFTLCAFGEEYRPALQLLGSRSGRDGDKISASGLTPEKARAVRAPVFREAELTLECRKIYYQDLDPTHFLSPDTQEQYPKKDYHRIYFGEILVVTALPKYAFKEK